MEVDLSLISLRIPQSRGVEHAGARGPSHPPSCFAERPRVQQKALRAQQQPCPSSLFPGLRRAGFAVDLESRKSWFEMALRTLIPFASRSHAGRKGSLSPTRGVRSRSGCSALGRGRWAGW